MQDTFEFTKTITCNLTYPEGKTKDNVVKVMWKPVSGYLYLGLNVIVFDDDSEVEYNIPNPETLENPIIFWEK